MPKKSKVRPSHTSTQHFLVLLRQHIPPFVAQRLSPMKEALRNDMQGLNADERQLLREALFRLGAGESSFRQWGDRFNAMLSSNPDNLDARVKELPDPPEEPPGMWERLLVKEQELNMTGVAACLTLYFLACARAVRAFKEHHNH